MARDIADSKKMQEYKKSVYAGSEFPIDEYTGNPMRMGASDTDHITSIKKVRERFPGLTTEQQKLLANDRSNFAETNPTLNRSKGGLENHEYISRQIKKGEKVDAGTAARMLSKEAESRTTMRFRATGMYVENGVNDARQFVENGVNDARQFVENNFHIDGEALDAATEAALMTGAISIIRNIQSVSDGNKTGKDAVKDIGFEMAGTAMTAYSIKSLSKGVSNGLGMSKDVSVLLATGTVQIAKSVTAYAKGDISFERMQDEVAEKSGMLVAAYIGKKVGAGAGAAIGELLFPAGGAVVGEKIGAFVGEMITTAVCSAIFEESRKLKQMNKSFADENSRVSSLARRAEREIRISQERMREMIDRENRELFETTNAGYKQMMAGIMARDYSGIYDGILKIGAKFGMDEEELVRGTVKKGHIFDHKQDTLLIC